MNGLRRRTLEEKEAAKGYLFLIPLMIGLLIFFIIPIIQSAVTSFCDINSSGGKEIAKWNNFANYKEVLFVNNKFLPTAAKAIIRMATTTPLIMIFRFFMASVLNQSFKGRTFFRIVLFLPVVIMMTAGATNVLETQMSGTSSYKDTFDVSAEAFTTQISAYLTDIGVSTAISDKIISITNTVYNIINLSGIQILIILTGMQSISPSLYEAAKVEGGTAWENFWKITFPMVSPLILTSFIYTIVDSFTSSTNGLMDLIRSTAFTNQQVALSSAMSILYFTAIAIIVGAVAWIVSKFVFYYDS